MKNSGNGRADGATEGHGDMPRREGSRGGQGTETGGDTDQKLAPSATGQQPPHGLTRAQQGDDPNGTAHGSPNGVMGGTAPPDGNRRGSPDGGNHSGPGGIQGSAGNDSAGRFEPPTWKGALLEIAGIMNFVSEPTDPKGGEGGVPGASAWAGWHGDFLQWLYIGLSVINFVYQA